MRITLTFEIEPSLIADLMTTAIESGDPVTTASRGGWCAGIFWRSRDMTEDKIPPGKWYAESSTYEPGRHLLLEVIEVDNERTGHETRHKVRHSDIRRGLEVMARKFPHLFVAVINDNIDASCADIFLQCILFGEEKYA